MFTSLFFLDFLHCTQAQVKAFMAGRMFTDRAHIARDMLC
jgi:hypothetical protein